MSDLGLLGILIGLLLLMALALPGWKIPFPVPLKATVVAAFSEAPLLAHWTQPFMGPLAGWGRAARSWRSSSRAHLSPVAPVTLLVASFVIAPMGQCLLKEAALCARSFPE